MSRKCQRRGANKGGRGGEIERGIYRERAAEIGRWRGKVEVQTYVVPGIPYHHKMF